MSTSKSKGRIGWLIDYPIRRSGGHKTYIDYANALIAQGYDVDLYVRPEGNHTPQQLKETIAEYLVPTDATIHNGWNVSGIYDVLIATWFKNAATVSEYQYADHKLYFVQDYDPYLQMMGDDYIIAERSYALGLTSFTMGQWLGKKLKDDFGAKVIPSFLGADLELYKNTGDKREPAVAVLFQPEKARRLAGLALATMKTIRRVRPDIKIYSYGSYINPNIEGVEHLGLLELDEIVKLFNTTKAGISFSSTNPSRTPFEMMAAGLPVVELYRENNLFDMPEKGTVLADIDAENIAAAAIDLIDDEALWEQNHKGGIQFMQKHSLGDAKQDFVDAIGKLTGSTRAKTYTFKPLYTKPAFIASEPFRVKNNRLRDITNNIGSAPEQSGSKINRFLERRRRFESIFKPWIRLSKVTIRATQIAVASVYLFMRDSFLFFASPLKQNLSLLLKAWQSNLSALRLRSGSYDLLSIDIFDTVLRRVCHPDDIKFKTAYLIRLKHYEYLRGTSVRDIFELRREMEHALGHIAVKDGHDFEYRIQEVLEKMLEALLPSGAVKDIAKEAEYFVDLEIEHEQTVTYPDRKTLKLLAGIKAKTKILLSDFYMTSQQLQRIVYRHVQQSDFDDLVTSADSKLNKISGRAFSELNKKHNVESNRAAHMGDSEVSDIAGAAKAGVRAHRVFHYNFEKKRLDLNNQFDKRMSGDFAYTADIDKALSSVRAPEHLSPAQRKIFLLGVKYAPVFYFYVQATIELALRYGIDKVHYFTREGIFFKKIHDELAKSNPLGLELPRSGLLEVSRIATFASSIRSVSVKEFMRIWNLYQEQSWEGLFKTLDIDIREFDGYFKQHKIDTTEVMKIAEHQQSLALLDDKKFTKELEAKIAEKARLLKAYLKHKEIDPETSGRVLISDIGWRGSIQDNLSYLMPDKEIFGSYLGLLPILNPQPAKVFKTAYGPNYITEQGRMWGMLTGITFLELISNSNTGSARGYSDEGGEVKVITKDIPEENRVFDVFTTYFQDGVLAAVPALSTVVNVFGISAKEARPYALERLSEMMLRPERPLTIAYFSLVHNDTFGDARELNMSNRSRIPFTEKVLAPFVGSVRKRVLKRADQSMWHNGLYVYNDSSGMLNEYFLFRKQIRRIKETLKHKLRSLS